MAEHEKRESDPATPEREKSLSTTPEGNEKAACKRPATNWEGYSLEILSVWFDP